MSQRLSGKRILVTQASDYMGPDTIALFEEHGAEIIADDSDLTFEGAVESLVANTGHIDVLVANLAASAGRYVAAPDTSAASFQHMYEKMVFPLQRLCSAVLPQMYERRQGKVVVFGSASGLKGIEGYTGYSSARTAQVGYVRTVGIEAARHNVQVNLIAQNYVENPVYYPPEVVEREDFQAKLKQDVPLGRLATGREDALFALFLASDESDFFVGQSIPFSGGWAQ